MSTAIGSGSLTDHAYEVQGCFDPQPVGSSWVIGFVVNWTEVHSVTTWSGRYLPADGTIEATWLMTTETDPGTNGRPL